MKKILIPVAILPIAIISTVNVGIEPDETISNVTLSKFSSYEIFNRENKNYTDQKIRL